MAATRAVTLLVFAIATTAVAAPLAHGAEPTPECTVLQRANVARCAVGASLAARSEELGLRSFEGRRRAAGVYLPSNPVVTVAGGQSIEPTVRPSDREALWGATLSQEIEIGGQRGRRLDVVVAEQRAQAARVTLARRAAAADALLLYFDVLAAIEEARLGARLAALSTALTTVARARAQIGLAADVEAQLAEAAAARLLQAQISAQARVASTTSSLATAVGQDPAQTQTQTTQTTQLLRVEGDLTPLDLTQASSTPSSLLETALARRVEMQIALSEARSQENKVALYERLRIPNPTVSLFVRNDWINERQLGLGFAFPIPVPSPIGRTYAGEIAEASSLAARAGTEAERLRRAIRLEVVKAQQNIEARRRQLDLFSNAQVRQTEDTLKNIADEIAARRLPIRDALLTQQALIDYLFAHVEAQRQLCFASVELARAAGIALDERVP